LNPADHHSETTMSQHAESNLNAFWMPFTANRQFKGAPRLLVAAKDMHFTAADGRTILDGTAGLWCVNLGHSRERINEAVARQIRTLEFAPTFQMAHPLPFELAARLVRHMPGDIEHVFFTNSGSESVDTALKIALAWHRARGEGSRTRFIGREKGYHGVGFGGISVGGLGNNRKSFGPLLPGVDHLPHTFDLEHNAFTRGVPNWGLHLADTLERIVTLHDASTIAAVIVEPVQGSAGVILPPHGYLKKLREICTKYGILLIFDEVITGFGRLGAPFGAQYFDVLPDMITTAKGITNGAIPMGAVFVRKQIHDAFMQAGLPENAIELFHGYTYSGHPVACAAALASLDIYEEEGLFTRAASLASYWEDGLHAMKGLPNVIDIRNIGLVGAVEMSPRPDRPGTRAYEVFLHCFEKGVLVRQTGETIALSPPLIVEKPHIDQMLGTLAEAIRTVG
jgi:beta-alanine--pyruvate transaminase